ncbi:MAG: hypothetical protein KatS3mg027_0177 [Bacteroidia bacterium]|nr:MAG: hypothetical protein KatS3mg027_0177 [Bacteroidia bacterium]
MSKKKKKTSGKVSKSSGNKGLSKDTNKKKKPSLVKEAVKEKNKKPSIKSSKQNEKKRKKSSEKDKKKLSKTSSLKKKSLSKKVATTSKSTNKKASKPKKDITPKDESTPIVPSSSKPKYLVKLRIDSKTIIFVRDEKSLKKWKSQYPNAEEIL